MADAGPPDPHKAFYVFTSGKKGSGKSVVCRAWFDPYPLDRIVIDPTHDLRDDFRADGVDFTELRADELPARLRRAEDRDEHDRARKTWLFCPDMGSDTAEDDMDRVVGLALGRGPTLLWCDEFGTQTTGNKTGKNMRRVLHHGRHDDLTFLVACPRPIDINPLAINQADLVYTFATKNPDDRDRVARNIGQDCAEFSAINADLVRRGPYWHTKYDDKTGELWIMPPLPKSRPGRNARPPIGEPGDLAPHDEAAAADELGAAARRGRS